MQSNKSEITLDENPHSPTISKDHPVAVLPTNGGNLILLITAKQVEEISLSHAHQKQQEQLSHSSHKADHLN